MAHKSRIYIMTSSALENYGEHWAGVRLVSTHKATRYMPAKDFYAKGQPEGFHPGFDEGAGCALYDLKREDTGAPLPMSLYAWELSEV